MGNCATPIPAITAGLVRGPVSKASPCCEWPSRSRTVGAASKNKKGTGDIFLLSLYACLPVQDDGDGRRIYPVVLTNGVDQKPFPIRRHGVASYVHTRR